MKNQHKKRHEKRHETIKKQIVSIWVPLWIPLFFMTRIWVLFSDRFFICSWRFSLPRFGAHFAVFHGCIWVLICSFSWPTGGAHLQFFMAALGADWQFFIASRGQPANGANMADQVARATWPTSWAGRLAWPEVCRCLTIGLGSGAGQPTPWSRNPSQST